MKVARKFHSKIKSPNELRKVFAAFKGKNKIVFTNGCFDLLHKGHVTYLEKARSLGDVLVIALNTDNSVKKLKGPDRPINKLRDRMSVIAALESVDFVTWFSADTPLQLIRLLKPKVLVKGGDWNASQIVGADDVMSWGGKVYSLPYVAGRSTTKILQKMRK